MVPAEQELSAVCADELSTVADNVFIISDPLGNIVPGESQGLFAADTRYLSQFELRIDGADIILLRSGSPARGRIEVYATNSGKGELPPHSIELHRQREIGQEFFERVEIRNHGDLPVEFQVSIECDADFADIFEVRAGPGRLHTRRQDSSHEYEIVLYDRRRQDDRQTRIRFNPVPASVTGGNAGYHVRLAPREAWSVDVHVRWIVPDPETSRPVPIARSSIDEESINEWLAHAPVLETDDPHLKLAYDQAVQDIAALEIALDSGHPIPAAGLPWYLAIFGRDSIITSHQCLLIGRRQAYGTLRTLAAYQSQENNSFRDAEPGKIPHEIRFGELAVSGRIPHARYYGTVDATSLWLILLHSAVLWSETDDIARELLPYAESALSWIENYGDLDGDGFIEYQRRSEHGLANQGWKDSWDSIRFADGRIAQGPIALVEVQGYVVAARRAMASILERFDNSDRAAELRTRADELQSQIHNAFWMPEEGYYALALDGEKTQVNSITSNPGHLLWAGAIDPEHAGPVAERLLSGDMYSGWGIRTMSNRMHGYNPVSYHNGSVWPHDNSLIVAGLARYGFADEALRVIDGMIDSTTFFDLHRLPELFCGYSRDRTPFPVDYPVACSPQAWASGSIVLMLQTLAGITPLRERLVLDPLPHGRRLQLDGVRFRGTRYQLRCEPGATQIASIERAAP